MNKNIFHEVQNVTSPGEELENDEYNVTSGIFSIREGLIRDCNAKFAEIFGYKVEEIVDRKGIEEFISLDDKQKFGQTISTFLISSQLKSTQEMIKIVKRNNSIANAKIYLSKALYEGKPSFIGSLIEISENKTMEPPVNILAQVIDNIGEGLILTDLDRTIFYVNETLIKTLGFSSEELLGKNINFLFEECIDQNNLHQLIGQKELDSWQFELGCMRKDGTQFLTILKKSLITNKKNLPIAELFTFKDISDKERMVVELRRSEYKYQNLFKEMHDAFVFIKVITDDQMKPIDLIVLEANKGFEFLTQIPNNELIGRSILQQISRLDDIVPNPLSIIGKIALSGTEDRFDIKAKNIDKWFSISAYSPKKGFAFIIIHDITEEKKAKEELEHSKQMLQESEILLQETQAIARLGSYVVDIPKGIWQSSTILDDIFGIDEKYIRSKEGWISLIHPEWREPIANYFVNQVLEQHAQFDVEFKIIRKTDGEERWVNALGKLVIDSKNQPVKVIGTISDITERKNAEEELKYSISLLEGTLESTVDGILVVDQNGKIERFNNKFLELWRIPESIIQTKNDDAALNFVVSQLKYPDQFLNKVKDLYKDITAESKDLLEFVDGRVFKRYSRPQLIGNKVVGRVWSFRDITDRKIAKESLIESEAKFRTLFETSIEGILVADINEKNTLVNQRMVEMTGYSVNELINMNFQQLIPPDELESHFLKIESRKKGDSEIYERKLLRKDGTIIWTLISAAPTFNKAGEYTGSFGVFTDITERKKMMEELIAAKEKAEEINRLKSIFLANISHELRTPLVGILGYAETLFNEIENPEFKEMAHTLLKSGTRLKETLNLILDLSIIEADHLTINLTRLSLTKIVREKLKRFYSFAEEKGLNLQMSLGNEYLEINADEKILSQVLEHLFTNAIKYTVKGNVTVSIVKILKNDKKYVGIKIKDTGIGISSQNAQLIFEPFRQASEGFARTFEGIGLGLTVAKKFIEMMGGEISVESEVGKGSEFTVKFPICSDADISFQKGFSNEKISDKQIVHNYKFASEVLLIEDDEPTANIVRFYLSETCKTAWAYNAKTAISMAEKKNYSAILLDINLGFGMNGIEAINEIKNIKGYSSIPIIAVTAYALYGDREKFLNQGCTDYISKPFGKDEIVALLDKVLGSIE